MFFVREKNRASRPQSPRVPQRHTEVRKPTGETRVNHYWSLWANIRPGLPFFIPFLCHPRQEKDVQLFPCNPKWRSLASPAHIFSFHSPLREEYPASSTNPLRGEGWRTSSVFQLKSTSLRRVAASSSSHQGNHLAIQALPTLKLRRDVLQENLQTATELHSPTEPRRQEPQNQQEEFTDLRKAQQLFSPFHGRVTQLGLIIIKG